MPHASPLLLVEDLHFSYPQASVLAGFHARVNAGLTLLCGDESAGKTTLLRLLAGDLSPRQGRLVLCGVDAAQSAQAYRAQVFWADPRDVSLDPCTAHAWLADQAQKYAHWDADALARHVHGFALAEHLGKTFYALSTGTRRKVCMAAALASHAPLTLLDDPIAGLDKPSVAYLAQALAASASSSANSSASSSNAAQRAVVVAHYAPLAGVPWDQVVELRSPA
jgi:ABC-type multidrug transport system ATPase subunit